MLQNKKSEYTSMRRESTLNIYIRHTEPTRLSHRNQIAPQISLIVIPLYIW